MENPALFLMPVGGGTTEKQDYSDIYTNVRLAIGQWFPPGTPVSSTSEADISSS